MYSNCSGKINHCLSSIIRKCTDIITDKLHFWNIDLFFIKGDAEINITMAYMPFLRNPISSYYFRDRTTSPVNHLLFNEGSYFHEQIWSADFAFAFCILQIYIHSLYIHEV